MIHLIGEKLVQLRKNKGLSQEKVAEALNVTRQTISNWETNQAMPTIDKCKELSKLYNVSLDVLVDNGVYNINNTNNTNNMKRTNIVLILIVILLIPIVFIILGVIAFNVTKTNVETSSSISMNCHLNDYDYILTYDSDGNFECDGCKTELYEELNNLIDDLSISDKGNRIEEYFNENNGYCD